MKKVIILFMAALVILILISLFNVNTLLEASASSIQGYTVATATQTPVVTPTIIAPPVANPCRAPCGAVALFIIGLAATLIRKQR